MKNLLRLSIILVLVAVGLIGSSSIVLADPPDPVTGEQFLCPVVGHGVLHASEVNNDNGVSAITPPVGTSLIPGRNQAGAHAKFPNAFNTKGPDKVDAGPGHNPEYSPLWPYHP
jgi:hypothetical protein